jgi:4-hydroxybenzoate polyprenyltransferase
LKIQDKWIGYLLWNNHFYGWCIVALSISSGLYLTGKIPSILLLAASYIATVIYYTNAYFNELPNEHNQARTIWYQTYHTYLKTRQRALAFILLILMFYIIVKHPALLNLHFKQIIILFGTVAITALYNTSRLKKNGVFKSVSIAFVWTIVGGYLPVYFFQSIETPTPQPQWVQLLYLFQLFLFILLLAILFDIKDMQRDKPDHIQTIPIQIGLDQINQKIVIPILLSYISIDVLLSSSLHFTSFAWMLHSIFYIGIYKASTVAIREKSIYKSILWIDGLMILRGIIFIASWYLMQ